MIVVSAMITIAEGKGDPHFLAYREKTAHLVKSRDIGRWQMVV